MKQFILLFSILFVPVILWAQTQNDLYTQEWQQADSFLHSGFPESASKIAKSIYDKAKLKDQDVQMMKAQLYMMSANFQRSDEAFHNAIQNCENNAAKSSFPDNAIWQSITAQLYWNYYQQNRWKILDRTKISSSTNISDFEQWDASRFFEKISQLYLASLNNSKKLAAINIERYQPILTKAVNTENLRPTLFDLLAFRAIDFFENDEKDITKPAFAFVMNDANAFGNAKDFIQTNFTTKDSSSLQWQALKLYQSILALHTSDQNKDAFLDADLARLEFVYNHSVLTNKKELYQNALQNLANQNAENPLSALASVRIAQLMMNENEGDNATKNTTNYPDIKEKLEKITAKFPESEGGALAQNLLNQILSKSLNITTEEVVLPNEASKILVKYRNIPKAFFRLVRLDNSTNKWIGNYYGYTQDKNIELLSLPSMQQWSTDLPGTEDYQQHSTEVKIDALKIGVYAIIVSSKENFATEDNSLSYAIFQVSNLSAITSKGQGFVLNRKTGMPIPNAKIDLFVQRYNDNIKGYDLIKIHSLESNKNGVFTIKNDERDYVAKRISFNKDTLIEYGDFLSREYNFNVKPQTATFFFTDRAIYRPGQTIFFKGIMIRMEEGGKKNEVLANEKTEVTFYDVNNQKIDSKKFTTNEFGSFSGSFKAPEGLFTGNMRIANKTGRTYISVEEYKRPKFAVSFEKMNKDFSLNEMVTVQGNAKAYAGNVIDQANVKYRVVRNASFPYWWCAYRWGLPYSAEMEITNGTTQTDAEGNFKISFKALPDQNVNPASLPVFNYTVTADVTDINGETRTNTTVVNIGYTSLQIGIDAPEKAQPEDLKTVSISSANLNGAFVATDVQLTISKLKSPTQILRNRLWEMPDEFLMDSLTFKKYFPNDVYKNEEDYKNWGIEKATFSKAIKTTKDGKVIIPENAWNKNGWYVIEVKGKDKNGKELIEKKYVQVWSEKYKGTIDEALVLQESSSVKEPGETAKVTAVSGFGQMHLIRQVQTMDDKNIFEQVDYKNQPLLWTKKITEADRGGVMVNYIAIKENRVYQEQAIINVPWTNKELNISWETHRDKLLPGAKETWTMKISGNKKEKIAAEMVATLYDASLDEFKDYSWDFNSLYPSLNTYTNWNSLGFGTTRPNFISFCNSAEDYSFNKNYLDLNISFLFGNVDFITVEDPVNGNEVYKVVPRKSNVRDISIAGARTNGTSYIVDGVHVNGYASTNLPPASINQLSIGSGVPAKYGDNLGGLQTKIVPRKNLQETAFFFPQLRTDVDGNIRLEFTMPEALTEWKMLAFAHTKDMSYGLLEGTVKTQKDLMVMPNLPRFFRQGDDIIISTKISNLSNQELKGTATLELMNAITLQPVNMPFRLLQKEQNFTVAKGQSTTASWELHVPESLYEPVVVRILAMSGNFTDGEENTLPVITNRMLVTETLPIWMNGTGTKTYSFDKLKYSDSCKTLAQHSLTVEYTSNPAWYALQSLPYLMEYPYECAEQTFNRYYASAIAANIIERSPRIKAIFEKWKNESNLSSFISPLEKNQELKSALLQETPWVLEAQNETEQRKRLAQLFDTYRLSKELNAALRKLKDMQLNEGGFPWFKGMRSDRYITQYILTGLGRLQQLGVKDNGATTQEIIDKAIPYLDREIKNSYDYLVKNKLKLDEQHIGYYEVQYLYMRSFFKDEISKENKTAYNYYLSQAAKYWYNFNPYMKGMIAIALHRNSDQKTAMNIIQSLKETAIHKEELGMYWMQNGSSYWWYEAPIEAQSLVIACFQEVANDTSAVNEMKIWLLKNKQTNSWATTKATADACYALLLSGDDWLKNEPNVVIKLGDKTINSEAQKQEAGTGYFKVKIAGKDVKPEMGKIQLTISNPSSNIQHSKSPSWGAVYWQYFENMDKITGAKTPLEIHKQLFIETNTASGKELRAITANNTLHVGDKVTVRIEIMVDRDMEYVQLKDMRAASFEPINVISTYKYQGGLGYYESAKDVSTNFFFDHLRKGKYVFEYPMFVQQKGNFSNGIATIQCMYAPEFSSHSEGTRVKVE